jgi:glycosyltransferase involved in cell wall biosynthesis
MSGGEGFRPIRVTQVEVSESAPDLVNLAGYRAVRALVRVHGFPVGVAVVPIVGTSCPGGLIRDEAVRQVGESIVRRLLAEVLDAGLAAPPTLEWLRRGTPGTPRVRTADAVTVVVCTRDRPADLATCLDALAALDPPPAEIIVVDNAPRDAAAREVTGTRKGVRYVIEPRRGLDWARNRGIAESCTAIVAFTDDDVTVDAGWAAAIQDAFEADAQVMAVTGLVQPLEIETESQELFERYGGFARGFERRWYRWNSERVADLVAEHGGAGKFGTGANMSFRRSLFEEIGGFDPALDVGTTTNGGGDLDMFFRVLAAGHTLAYEPAALVLHRHRRTYPALRTQLANNGVGFYSYVVRSAWHMPSARRPFAHLAAWWFGYWNLRRLAISFLKPGKFPRDLIVAELLGSLRGLLQYPRARREADRMSPDAAPQRRPEALDRQPSRPSGGGPSVGLRERVESFAKTLAVDLLGETGGQGARPVLPAAIRAVRERFGIEPWQPPALAREIGVSVVVPTLDRPESLRRCLASLTAQTTSRPLEIIVVDNNPTSGRTAPLAAEFAPRHVHFVTEARRGLSFARNAGIRAATGGVIVATDDDVTVPDGWIEALAAPFSDPEIMTVTGNVIAADLSGEPQRLFEAYGGLSRGDQPHRVDATWFWAFRKAVPTWQLGATANAAFRASIFRDPRIGLLDEALGAGTPAGCSEDTYLFYRVLRAGYAIQYEPRAWVWHHHRTDVRALRRQIYSYAKGHVAYQLTTLLRHGDLRALERLTLGLPRLYALRTRDYLRGTSRYPVRLIAVEIAGTLAGPWALWRSRRRVARLTKNEGSAHVVSSEARVLQDRAS